MNDQFYGSRLTSLTSKIARETGTDSQILTEAFNTIARQIAVELNEHVAVYTVREIEMSDGKKRDKKAVKPVFFSYTMVILMARIVDYLGMMEDFDIANMNKHQFAEMLEELGIENTVLSNVLYQNYMKHVWSNEYEEVDNKKRK